MVQWGVGLCHRLWSLGKIVTLTLLTCHMCFKVPRCVDHIWHCDLLSSLSADHFACSHAGTVRGSCKHLSHFSNTDASARICRRRLLKGSDEIPQCTRNCKKDELWISSTCSSSKGSIPTTGALPYNCNHTAAPNNTSGAPMAWHDAVVYKYRNKYGKLCTIFALQKPSLSLQSDQKECSKLWCKPDIVRAVLHSIYDFCTIMKTQVNWFGNVV